ncbi:MAG TPA: SCP2 sterol-binding domain-containing protein [Burkholderiaceae bacterium]|nr:SCP2 sterol-binding domain-containing protein [Burkholderiaceae bacterium]
MTELPLPLAQGALSALNHVLRQQQWARDRLRAHAGRSVRIVVESPLGPVSSEARIGDDGTLTVASVESPTVTLSLRPSIDALFGMLRDGPRGLTGHLKVEGDVMVAAAIGEIAQQLRWDVEEDLSRLVGDRIAHRMGETARGGARQAEVLRERVETGVRQFLVDEDRQLVGRDDLRTLADAVRSLEDGLARLEARIGRAAS